MKAFLRIFIFLVVISLAIIALAYAYINIAYPKVGMAPVLNLKPNEALLEHGEYLANHVAVCMDCHSQRQNQFYTAPILPGTLGSGGEKYSKEMGFPGDFYASNITPYHLGAWSDGEVYRAIVSGVSRDGSPLFPVMPYHSYGKMSHVDVEAIIAYLRTLPSLETDIPASQPNWIMKTVMKMMPSEPEPLPKPSAKDTVQYGGYLSVVALCLHCHTPLKQGQPVEELAFAGGRAFNLPEGGTVYSANITPSASGIGNWSKKDFMDKFRFYGTKEGRELSVENVGHNSIMPWTSFAGMKKADLEAIYHYLMTLQPIENEVPVYFPSPQ